VCRGLFGAATAKSRLGSKDETFELTVENVNFRSIVLPDYAQRALNCESYELGLFEYSGQISIQNYLVHDVIPVKYSIAGCAALASLSYSSKAGRRKALMTLPKSVRRHLQISSMLPSLLYFRHRLLNESPKMDYIADSDFLYQCAHR
jgi:hypothetical protein